MGERTPSFKRDQNGMDHVTTGGELRPHDRELRTMTDYRVSTSHTTHDVHRSIRATTRWRKKKTHHHVVATANLQRVYRPAQLSDDNKRE